MDPDILALRHRLLLALGLVGGVALGSSCLDTAPLDECIDAAQEDDEIEIVLVEVGGGEQCPNERDPAVEDAAQELVEGCPDDLGVRLRYVACGPLEDRADESGFCEYVAVYNKPPCYEL